MLVDLGIAKGKKSISGDFIVEGKISLPCRTDISRHIKSGHKQDRRHIMTLPNATSISGSHVSYSIHRQALSCVGSCLPLRGRGWTERLRLDDYALFVTGCRRDSLLGTASGDEVAINCRLCCDEPEKHEVWDTV